MIRAIIDVGSNSIKMRVADVSNESESYVMRRKL